MTSCRVFISYSHEDIKLVEELVKVLEGNGLRAMWDRNFTWGRGFHDQIKNHIAHAHVFMPVLTQASSNRGWVHQEIGYAMALNIPVLPIADGKFPDEMLYGLQALQWENDIGQMKSKLTRSTFDHLIDCSQRECHPYFECAEAQVDRVIMMAEYAARVTQLNDFGHVRQKATLSIFHVPNTHVRDPILRRQYPKEVDPFRLKRTIEERKAMEKHAREKGCSLIIHHYQKDLQKLGIEAYKARLEVLLDFLESMPPDKDVRVAIQKDSEKAQNVTIVGDFFAAESISGAADKGWDQTIFTRYAPTVQARIEAFDKELNSILKGSHMTDTDTRI